MIYKFVIWLLQFQLTVETCYQSNLREIFSISRNVNITIAVSYILYNNGIALSNYIIITFNIIKSIGFYKDIAKIGYYHIQYFYKDSVLCYRY